MSEPPAVPAQAPERLSQSGWNAAWVVDTMLKLINKSSFLSNSLWFHAFLGKAGLLSLGRAKATRHRKKNI